MVFLDAQTTIHSQRSNENEEYAFLFFPKLSSFRLEEEKHFVGSISVKSYRVNNYEPVSIHAGFYRFADMHLDLANL